MHIDKVQTSGVSDRRLGMRLIAEEGYRNLFEGKDPNSGLKKKILHHDNALGQDLKNSWQINPLQKWTIHLTLPPAIFGFL
jgi:hypothetical protein